MPVLLKREYLVSAFFFLAFGALLFLLAQLLAPYAAPVTWAVVLAVVFYPLHKPLAALIPRWPNLAAGAMTTLVFALAVVPTLLLSGVVAREAVAGYQRLAAFVSEGHLTKLDELGSYWLIAPIWQWARDRMASGDVDPSTFLLSGVRWMSEFAASRAAAIARNVFSFFVGTGIMAFTLFFAFRDGRRFMERLESAVPMAERDRRKLFVSLQMTILAVVQGLAVTAFLQGCLLTIGLWVLDVPFFLLLGTAGGFLAFLPVGGAALVWAPTVAGLWVAGELTRGIILLVWGALVVSGIDNIVKPVLIGSRARLSTPMLFFGIIGGLQAYGLIGLFLGPSLLAAFSCLMGIYREQYLDQPAGPSLLQP